MKAVRTLVLLAALLGTVAFARAQEHVSFPSLDGAANAPVVLTGLWFAAPTSPAPAVALFHGCGGAFDRRGQLNRRMREYAALFNRAGYHALIVDSLTPRYETELCTQRVGARRVTQSNRRLDALGAVAYLAERSDVDAKKIGLVGWSNGGSTVLAATNLRHRDVAAAQVQPAFAIAFYPGCEADLKRGYEATAPLLLLIGQSDDWTPPGPCRALARQASGPKPEIEGYAGAYHGFDSDAPVRLRKDVPNGVNPGQGVHVGGNGAAWRASQERLLKFLAAREAASCVGRP
ncbi:MAG: dienelactone hydrolase family protein [Caldimonas sp.]